MALSGVDFVAHHRQELRLVLFSRGGPFAGLFQFRHIDGVDVVIRLVVHTAGGHLVRPTAHVHLKAGDRLTLHGLVQGRPQRMLGREPLPFLHFRAKRLPRSVVRQHHLPFQPQAHHRIGVDLEEPRKLRQALLPQTSAHFWPDVGHVLKNLQMERLEKARHCVF